VGEGGWVGGGWGRGGGGGGGGGGGVWLGLEVRSGAREGVLVGVGFDR